MLYDNQKDYIIKLIQDGKQLPEDFKYLLFPTNQKEYELSYAGKMRKEDLLANEDGVFPVSLQVDKIFNEADGVNINTNDWKNMIIFGDNLQFLKTIYENKDPLIKDKVKGRVKLIYIDPPFATSDEFQNKSGAKAYNDKKKGAEFVEFLRRRLILAKEILADDGVLFIHLDQKMSHYIKIVLDEIFGKNYFKNEIIWHYDIGTAPKKDFKRKHDTIFRYSKSDEYYYEEIIIPPKNIDRYDQVDSDGRKYMVRGDTGKIVYADEGQPDDDVWTFYKTDELRTLNSMAKERTTINYPTQKPEKLIERIIRSSTKEGDIVLDFFGGSGTTMAVAEKLNRKWISCDLGKLAFFTMQKRILQIQDSKDLNNSNNAYNKPAKPFVTAQLGVYNLKKTFDLKWIEYKQFVSGLFEVELMDHSISGIEFDGKKSGYPVKIFDYRKFKDSSIDQDYLEELNSIVRNRIDDRIYIVAPANYIDFLTDYFEIDGVRYYFLKVPYQIIKELHRIPFSKLRQPQSKKNLNNIDEVVGFHFIRQPEVKTEIVKAEGKIDIKIHEFRSQYSKDDKGQILENFESLSAVFIDKNYNGKHFAMDESYFAKDLLPDKKGKNKEVEDSEIREDLKLNKENILSISLDESELGEKIMIVYTDIYGNDFTEVFSVEKGV